MRKPFQRQRRVRERVALASALALVTGSALLLWQHLAMPGESHGQATLPASTAAQRALAEELRRDVRALTEFGERSARRHDNLQRAAGWIEQELGRAGLTPARQSYEVGGRPYHNLEVEIPGTRASDLVVVGAHYDSAPGTVGANDNGSGVAALLALARRSGAWRPERTLRLVFFTNEEPPFFQTADMGSVRYAQHLHASGVGDVAMLSLETMGYYSDEPGSQAYPPAIRGFYPDTGHFIAFVGDVSSSELTRRLLGMFREQARFPSEGASLPRSLPGVGWSDHWAFWQQGYPAVMVTDTAPFRYPHYHTADDTPDKLDYGRLARVVEGLARVIPALANDG